MAELNKSGTQTALLAAIDYINKSPCDPNSHAEQFQAWKQYLSALTVLGLDRFGNPLKESPDGNDTKFSSIT